MCCWSSSPSPWRWWTPKSGSVARRRCPLRVSRIALRGSPTVTHLGISHELTWQDDRVSAETTEEENWQWKESTGPTPCLVPGPAHSYSLLGCPCLRSSLFSCLKIVWGKNLQITGQNNADFHSSFITCPMILLCLLKAPSSRPARQLLPFIWCYAFCDSTEGLANLNPKKQNKIKKPNQTHTLIPAFPKDLRPLARLILCLWKLPPFYRVSDWSC